MLDEERRADHQREWRALLRRSREERAITRSALSSSTGLSESAIRAYESGDRQPSAKALQAIISALGLPGERANAILQGAGFAHDPQSLMRLRPIARTELVGELRGRPWPAFVANQSFEVVLSNGAFNLIFDVRPDQYPQLERSFLARLSDETFAARLRNWDEVVTYMIGLAKGDPRWNRDLAQPLAWIARGLEQLSQGSPKLIRRLVDLWDKAPAIKPALRYSYRIEWTAPDGHDLSFHGLTMLADIWDELHWNEWIPSNGRTWDWFEKLPSWH